MQPATQFEFIDTLHKVDSNDEINNWSRMEPCAQEHSLLQAQVRYELHDGRGLRLFPRDAQHTPFQTCNEKQKIVVITPTGGRCTGAQRCLTQFASHQTLEH